MTSETNSDSIGSGENAAIPADFPAYLNSFPFSNTTSNLGRGAVVNGTDGNDSIENHAGDVYIYGFDGDDYIYTDTWYDYRHRVPTRYVEYEYIYGGYWEYSYIAGYVTINAGLGNDTIHNADDNEVYMQYVNGDGDDVLLYHYGTIQIADGSLYTKVIEGNDQIIRVGLGSIRVLDAANENVKISGGALQQLTTVSGTAGDDNLSNVRMYAIIDGGAGDDTVTNFAYYASIGAGAGNDIIINSYSSSINAGTGNDLISLSSAPNIIEYSSGDGNDSINGYSALDTIKILDGSDYSTLARGSDVIVSIGSGSMLLTGAADKALNIVGGNWSSLDPTSLADPHSIDNFTADTLISGTDEDDTLRNHADGVTLDGGSGNNVFYNWDGASSVSINGGEGNDLIYNDGSNVTIESDAGDDYVENFGAGTSISGGDGDDTVWNYGSVSGVTLDGGAGDDLIRLAYGAEVINYVAGEGDDTIINYDVDDTVNIIDGAGYQTVVSGDDIVISLEGGSMTLKDAAGKEFNIAGGILRDPHSISNSTAETLLVGTDEDDTISNSASDVTLNGGAGNDVINLDGGTAIVEYAIGDGNDEIYGYDTDSTLHITDGSEYATMIADADMIIAVGDGSITLKDAADKPLNIDGGTYQIDDDTTESPIEDDTTAAPIEDDTTAAPVEDDTTAAPVEDDTTAAPVEDDTTAAPVDDDTLNQYISNAANNTLLVGGDGDDTLVNSGSNVTLMGGDGNDIFRLKPNGAMAVHITDFKPAFDAIEIQSSGTRAFIYEINDDGLNLKDNTGNVDLTIDIGANFSQVRDFRVTLLDEDGNVLDNPMWSDISTERIKADSGKRTELKLAKNGKTLTATKDYGGGLFNAADYGDDVKTIKATAAKTAVNVIGNALDNKISVGKYGSTIEGGGGDDLIKLGKGVDVVVYADGDGDDTIKSYKAGDKIRLVDGAIDSVSIKGSTVKLNVGDGSLTIKSVVKKELTIIDADGVESTYKFTKQNNDLDSARITIAEQFATEDYWFDISSNDESPLNEIMASEAAIDLSDFGEERLKRSVAELITGSARRHQK